MNDIITEYTLRHEHGVSILVLGLPLAESNHHIYAEALYHEVRKRVPDVPVVYASVHGDAELSKIPKLLEKMDSDGGLLILSSNLILRETMPHPDFTLFIDTPATVLTQRGVENALVSKEDWDIFKKEVQVSRYMNDYLPFTLQKIEDAVKPGKPWKLFFELWRTVMRLVIEAIHKEDTEKGKSFTPREP